jgi:hypothetical protein
MSGLAAATAVVAVAAGAGWGFVVATAAAVVEIAAAGAAVPGATEDWLVVETAIDADVASGARVVTRATLLAVCDRDCAIGSALVAPPEAQAESIMSTPTRASPAERIATRGLLVISRVAIPARIAII